MALNAYLKLKGETQGIIKGSVTQKGLEDLIMVVAVNHEINVPHVVGSIISTGKRQHNPLVITKTVDRSSPALYHAMARNESFSEFILQFYAPTSRGTDANHYTIKLTNATILHFKLNMSNNLEVGGKDFPVIETISFGYEQIEWIWTSENLTAQDTVLST